MTHLMHNEFSRFSFQHPHLEGFSGRSSSTLMIFQTMSYILKTWICYHLLHWFLLLS
jgi:hypothetical protein